MADNQNNCGRDPLRYGLDLCWSKPAGYIQHFGDVVAGRRLIPCGSSGTRTSTVSMLRSFKAE